MTVHGFEAGGNTFAAPSTPTSANLVDSLVPTKLAIQARFQVQGPVAEGAQGRVFRGIDTEHDDALVALKVVHDAAAESQLIREFEHLRPLSHPGLTRVLALQRLDSKLCLVSEFVDGDSARDRLLACPEQQRPALLLTFADALAGALAHLHAQGLVHGDVKLDNLRCPRLGCPQHGPQPVVLLDLGLARRMGPGDCRGTPTLMAPEALAGYLDAQSDLYSLGITLIETASGRQVFPQPSNQLFSAILAGDTDPVATLLPGYPEPLTSLLQDMIAVDRGTRPHGMNALRLHIRRVAETLGTTLPASANPVANFQRTEFVGRETEAKALATMITQFAAGNTTESIVEVAGPSQSGRARLIEEALLRAQVALARNDLPCPMIRRMTLSDAIQVAETQASPAIWVLQAPSDQALSEFLSRTLPRNILLLVIRDAKALLGPQSIRLGPLSLEASKRLCHSLALAPLNDTWVNRACELSKQMPGTLVALMRAAASVTPRYEHSPDTLFHDDALSQSLIAQVSRLPKLGGQVMEMLAVAARPLSWSALAALMELDIQLLSQSTHELIAAGLVTVHEGNVACVSQQQGQVIDAHLPRARRRALHRRVLQGEAAQLSPAQHARHLLVVGPATEAAQVSLAAIESLMKSGHLQEAKALCLDSASTMRGKTSSQHASLAAEVALLVGDYDMAEIYATAAKRSRGAHVRHKGMRVLAKCAQHRGDAQGATRVLQAIVKQTPTSGLALADLAKNLLARGQLRDALKHARTALPLASTTSEHFSATEIAGLAHLYLGELSEAAQQFQSLLQIAEQAGKDRLLGRALGLLGMLSQKNSDLQQAADLYSQAAELSHRSGAIHASAVFHLNEATALQRMAHYSKALTGYQRALPGLLRAGTPFELSAAHCNRGNLLLVLGELESAKREADTALALADQAQEPRIHFFVHLLLGELAQREHQQATALAHYQDALALADEHSLSDRTYALMLLAQAHAVAKNTEAQAIVSQLSGDSEEHRGEILVCTARVALALGTTDQALVSTMRKHTSALLAHGDLDLGWRSSVLVARMMRTLGQSTVDSIQEAQRLFAEVNERCPEAYRAGLARHPDAIALSALVAQIPSPKPDATSNESASLRRLLALSRRLNSEQRIESLLDEIIDTAVELSRAERAFLMLRDREGALHVRVARHIDHAQLGSEEEVSRSIAERAATTGQVIMTVDAEMDQRFDTSRSVAALHLRSVLAVPFRVKDRIVGTLYLDHRFRRSAFNDEAVEVVRELADIAAVALENTRLVRENQEREQQIAQLNEQLETRLQDTEVELARTLAKIPKSRPARGFAGIIGSSAALRSLLDVAERAANSDLSVVISGESGTGKELLARAIHNSSGRATQAFVPINCGAIPDNLLEAELFGYVRGAFTGAQRSKRGLFEVADKGTLFLDEIADTSLAMQSKLLRALQEGEVRPLGAEKLQHVDIRILCASNKNLSEEVQAGRFREDLYYRLKVLELHVPALRDRREDIAELAQHLMRVSGHSATLSASALHALQAHDWPGNVRELENELARASAMSDDSVILVEHLSSALRQRPSQPQNQVPESLSLKPQVEALERRLVEEAMRKTGNNQSKAAILLGLSRYGLQKKLQRYGIVGSRVPA